MTHEEEDPFEASARAHWKYITKGHGPMWEELSPRVRKDQIGALRKALLVFISQESVSYKYTQALIKSSMTPPTAEEMADAMACDGD
jgi:hypothetical protein